MGAWSCSDPRKGKSWSTGRSWSCCLQFTEPQGSGPGSSKAAQNPWENPNAAPKAPPSLGLARIAAHPKIPPGGGKPGGVFGSLDVQIQVPGSMSHLGMALPKQIPAFNCSCGGSGGIFGILHVQIQVRGSMSPLGMALPKPNSTLQPSLGCSGRSFGMLDVQIRVAGSVSPLPGMSLPPPCWASRDVVWDLWGWNVAPELSHHPGVVFRVTLSRSHPSPTFFGAGNSKIPSRGCHMCLVGRIPVPQVWNELFDAFFSCFNLNESLCQRLPVP